MLLENHHLISADPHESTMFSNKNKRVPMKKLGLLSLRNNLKFKFRFRNFSMETKQSSIWRYDVKFNNFACIIFEQIHMCFYYVIAVVNIILNILFYTLINYSYLFFFFCSMFRSIVVQFGVKNSTNDVHYRIQQRLVY